MHRDIGILADLDSTSTWGGTPPQVPPSDLAGGTPARGYPTLGTTLSDLVGGTSGLRGYLLEVPLSDLVGGTPTKGGTGILGNRWRTCYTADLRKWISWRSRRSGLFLFLLFLLCTLQRVLHVKLLALSSKAPFLVLQVFHVFKRHSILRYTEIHVTSISPPQRYNNGVGCDGHGCR